MIEGYVARMRPWMAATALLLGPDVSATVFNLYLTKLQLKFGTQVLLTNPPQRVIPPKSPMLAHIL